MFSKPESGSVRCVGSGLTEFSELALAVSVAFAAEWFSPRRGELKSRNKMTIIMRKARVSKIEPEIKLLGSPILFGADITVSVSNGFRPAPRKHGRSRGRERSL
jgi:hypothetical protein